MEEGLASPPELLRSRPSTGDWIGGVSVALVLIPQSIAYATIAGLPPVAGLYAASVPLMAAAPFVSCPWLQTGPVALTSLLTFGALANLEFADDAERAGAAAVLAIIVGATRLLLGLRRLGGFTRLLTPAVVVGFTTAAAILIISSQFSKTLGCLNQEANVLTRSIVSICHPGTWNVYAILLSLVTAAIAWFGRKIHRLFPSIFVAVIFATLVGLLPLDLGPTVGELPGGFVGLKLDLPWRFAVDLLFAGIVIAFIGFAEPASISLTLMGSEQMRWNPHRELCGGGCANIVSGLVGGYPIGGSFSRSSINKFAGATTPWSGLITGAIVMSMVWATPMLATLPQAALGAIIIVAVSRLLKIREMLQMLKHNRIHGVVAVFTLAATLVSAPRVDIGILIGVVTGIGVTVWEKVRQEPATAPESPDDEGSADNEQNAPSN